MAPTLGLPAELTIYTAAELRTQWLAWAAASDDEVMTADASAVAEVDGAGAQLVLSLARLLERDARTLEIRDASEAFAAACRTLGLASLIGERAPA